MLAEFGPHALEHRLVAARHCDAGAFAMNRFAVARPMPLVPPVINADLSLSLIFCSFTS